MGETVTGLTVEGAKTTVIYTSSNTAVATVDSATGALTLVGAGNTTITATAAENDEYSSASASYVLTVAAAGVVNSTVTVTFSTLGYENGTYIETVNADSNITLTFEQNGNSNGPKYYNTGTALRLYPDNKMTVSGGTKNISKIEFTWVQGKSGSTTTLDVNTGTLTETVWTGSSNSVVFTAGGSGHLRVSKVIITYAE